MGLFDSLFGKGEVTKKEEKVLPWIPLVSLEQLEEVKKNSKNRPQLIFKHSTTCGISRMVIKMFTDGYNFSTTQFDLYYLDLHNNRDVSDETAYKFQLQHQSPQLLVIRDGVVVAHASHGAIAEINLDSFL